MTAVGLDIDRLRSSEAASSAGRVASRTLTLGAGGEPLPAASELAALLARVPVGAVHLAEPVDLAEGADQTATRGLAVVRECSSIGVRVIWSLVLGPLQDELVTRLDHLPAPEQVTVPGQGRRPLGEWRSINTFDLFYFRKGPRFLSIVERRAESTRHLIVTDPAEIEVLHRGLDGCTGAELAQDARHLATAGQLVAAGLLLRLGDSYVTLPAHMRSWPIGAKLLTGTLASAGPKQQSDEAAGPTG